ncbi:LLM class flavin-dependent oxidoreductase [Methylobacterium trifolii]|uniref:FMNH(2)-dependent dimethylsulfone monooxygenase n=1 Tax=Methylobacterium trifolii TaxID=1003092 RepID=A0ABQ4TYT8_9HYPH|nr:LLM class flavin-dependent oxidoreductase [Methylobacterium trifolii]GJE59168.1 FMNH(2)-dependent dimethylsulfone monooxygenase [Methylobacterium trifolii]
MAGRPLRFGIWAAVHGSRAAHHDPDEPDDATWERNRALVLEAEALGFDSVLVAQHTMNPYDETRDQLEAWTASAALAALTTRIEIVAAIKPGLYHPVVLAKMALQIEHVSGGRFGLNLVNAWNRAEFERAGLPFPAHDARYAYGREWIGLVDRLMRGESVSFAGAHFRVEDYRLRPAGTHRVRPRIYLGGESEPARALAADHADLWFINGQPLEEVEALIADVARRPRPGAPLAYGLSAFVIARETDAQAQAEHARLLALAGRDAALRADTRARTDAASVMFAKTDAAAARFVGTNGGTAAGLVGSYETVAARIRAFHGAGIELFMLQFQPFEAEMARFAERVLPRLR